MDEPPIGTLATKINRLFEVIRRPDRTPYRNEEVATACREATGESFSTTYLWQLRNGKRTNPTKRHLEALAQFFQVPAAYFFDDEQSSRITEELELLGALRDNAVRQIALRAVTLSPAGLDTISDMIDVIGRREARQAGPSAAEPSAAEPSTAGPSAAAEPSAAGGSERDGG